jgi:hypothetical protein
MTKWTTKKVYSTDRKRLPKFTVVPEVNISSYKNIAFDTVLKES